MDLPVNSCKKFFFLGHVSFPKCPGFPQTKHPLLGLNCLEANWTSYRRIQIPQVLKITKIDRALIPLLKRGVLDIDLQIPTSRDICENSSFYPLPSKIFESKTLVRLKIQFKYGVNIHVKRGVSLPKLRTLHLDYIKIETSTFNKLLSGCHGLEELVLVNVMWGESEEPSPVTVSIPTLKRLKFCRSKDFYEADFHEYGDYDEEKEGVSLSFDNPNLVYLEYSDAIVDKYKQVSFDSLVEANLRLRNTPDGDQTETDKFNVPKLLMGIRNVKILYLSNDTLEVLACCRRRIRVFDNLIELTINTTPYVGWESLPPLLKSCPSLETLVFEGLYHNYTDRCRDKDGCLCKYDNDWGVKMDVRTCLSSSPVKVLKILKFGKTFDDDDVDRADDDDDDQDAGSCDEVGDVAEEQIEHVKHFLETMPDLEQVILYYNTPNDQRCDESIQETSEASSSSFSYLQCPNKIEEPQLVVFFD
ncbi:PREDICTED: putative F-box/LRR-repeat protein At5g41840 [Camelina sativa]|uniref:F-box/LRR-repeat protein At5g41840 n=1 Tax=Camelina sativa TaxID=90675 RepID=A0ABM1RBX1_CAMSA|nr:PREDICTED: putative F-box/LRR-repeat protein At5g41840 [Camelina sativa]